MRVKYILMRIKPVLNAKHSFKIIFHISAQMSHWILFDAGDSPCLRFLFFNIVFFNY